MLYQLAVLDSITALLPLLVRPALLTPTLPREPTLVFVMQTTIRQAMVWDCLALLALQARLQLLEHIAPVPVELLMLPLGMVLH